MSLKNKIFVVSFFAFVFLPFFIYAQNSSTVNINLQVTGACNNNGVCESDMGESLNSCPTDCQCNKNGVCEQNLDENAVNCSEDCASKPVIPTGSGGSFPIIFNINNVFLGNISTNSADVSWQTNKFSLCQLSMGKTSDYGQEVFSETNYVTSHSAKLSNLDYSTVYHFRIICQTQSQEKIQTQDRQFTTLAPLSNVGNFAAIWSDSKITLNWDNPTIVNFNGVKILKSKDFYPLNIADGAVIYEGFGNSFEDFNIKSGENYYYAIFVFDKNGNHSSGSILSVSPNKTSVPPVIYGKPLVKKVTINDFKFSSGTKTFQLKNGTIEAQSGVVLNVSADCNKILEAKTVIVNLQKKDKTSSFILKQEKSDSCNVSFSAPADAGVYPLNILIIDSKNQIISQFATNLKVLSKNERIFGLNSVMAMRIYVFGILMILFFVVLMSWRKSGKVRAKWRF